MREREEQVAVAFHAKLVRVMKRIVVHTRRGWYDELAINPYRAIKSQSASMRGDCPVSL